MVRQLFESRRNAARRRNPRWTRWITGWLRGRHAGGFRIDTFAAGFEPLEGRAVLAAFSLTGSSYTQDFTGLGTTTGTAVTGGDLENRAGSLAGWFFAESGTNANTTITAGTGSASAGDTYNFGAASGATQSDRALGGLRSGSLIPSWGFQFTNNTGGPITSLVVSYRGETWRVGATNRSDRIDFQYSANATSLTTGTWTDVDALDYANPGQGTTANGSVIHAATITGSIAGLSIAAGSSFFVRWTDFDATGSDDGMAVDDFSLTVTASTPAITVAGGTSATATAFTTTYGTASAAQTFAIAGSNLTAAIAVAAVTGFEFSTDGTTWGTTASFAPTGGTVSGTLHVRLAATAAVGGTYDGRSITLSSAGATARTISTASSGNAVAAQAVTITGLSAESKNWDGTTTVVVTGTPAYAGLVNGESFTVTGSVTWAFADANVGTDKSLVRTGAYATPFANYTVTQPTLTASIVAVAPSAPTITGIVAGDGQLTVGFTAPASAGGAAITNYKVSTDGGATFTALLPASTVSPIVIMGLTNDTAYGVRILAVNAAGDGAASATVTATPSASIPTLVVSATEFAAAFTTTYGTASAEQSFTVSGTSLTGDVTVTAPEGFEVSITSGAGFGATATLAPEAGSVAGTTVFLRLRDRAAAGTYDGRAVTIASQGAVTRTISTTASGNAVATATLTVSGATAQSKTYDGTTAAVITGATLAGVLPGDDVSIASRGGTFASANVGTGITVTAALVLGGTAAANYTVSQPTGLAADIAQATQAITFPALPTDKKVGDAAFPAGASTSAPPAAGLVIAYASSNPAVATVAANGTITLVAPGVTTITASQAGSANVAAAASVSRTLQVGVASSSSQSTTLGWTFTPDANPTSGVVTGLAVSAISQGNNNGTTTLVDGTSASSGYPGASGGNNAGAAARIGVLNTAAGGSAYFQFTLTPSAGTSFTVTALSFGSRSTGSGPTSYTLRSSADNYGADLATGTMLANATWALESNTGLVIAGSAATTFRIYGFGGSGGAQTNTANWRIDDLAVVTTVTSGSSTPAITPSGTAAGVSTTYGLASTASQFIVSGGGLTAPITATAPAGFEVSSDGTTFAGTAAIPQSGGFADGVVFVRLAASAPAGSYGSSVVTLSSAGAVSRTVAIGSSTVAKAALVITAADVVTTVGSVPPTGPSSTAFTTTGLVGGQTVGSVTIAITQGTTTAGTFAGAVVPSAATGGTFNPANYDVSYAGGALVVTESSAIVVTGAFSALTTTYGTASSITTVGVSATGLTGPITATAPAGFQVSSDGGNFGATATFAATDGAVSGTLTLRLAATAPAGTRTGGVGLTSPGVAFVTVPVAASTVNAKPLTISGLVAQDKDFDGTTTAVVVGTPSYVGLVNGESFAVTGTVTWAFPDAAAGTGKPLVQTGAYAAPSANYTVLQPTLTATIRPAASVTLFTEDFAALTTGNSTSTAGSSTLWNGSANWSSVTRAYQAGGSVKLGTSSAAGSITTKTLDLSGNGGVFTVSFAVKGWSTIEGNISVTVTGLAAQTVTYTATISAAFQTRTLQFTGGQANSTITFATTAGRAFLDDIVVTGGTPTPVTTGIGGFVWNDADGDGVWNQLAEMGIPGRTVYLDLDRNGAVGTGEPTTVTAVDGSYEFTGLAAGTYIVAQVVPAGWQQTSPAIVAAQIRSTVGSGVQVATFTDPAYMPAERQQGRRFVPNDPLFAQQWHLQNTGQRSGTAGEDARVVNAWDVAKGTGVVIGIVDDGLERTHPDLAPAYRADLSYDFNGNDADPMPGTGDDHGTAAAGVAAARGNNSIGVSGSAPGASLAGLRLISATTTDQQEATGLTYKPQDIAIYSNSWGPADNGTTLEAPGPLTRAALANAVQTGRGGKGSIYVWAAGNGLGANDNSNYDGYANSRYTIAVTAVDNRGKQSWYAEPGANILVAAPSSGDSSGTDVGIVTVDRAGSAGYNVSATASPTNLSDRNYTNDFGGTSSATPLVSGVVALMLEANPNLGWRDVQHVLANSARRNDVTDVGWSQNAAGKWVNHKYGFGVVDAAAAVNLAKTWTNVGAETSATSGTITVGQTIPDNSAAGLTSTYTLGADIRMESVEVVFSATHASRGHLQVVLTSPSGTKSVLAEKHADTGDNYSAWMFSTVRNWGESSKGTWSLTVSDLTAGTTGTFGSWAINVYGTALPAPAGSQTVTVTTGQVVSGINFGTRSLLPAIALDGTLAGVSTTYGTASGTSSITVSGTNLATAITATAPAGFQVSADGTTYGPTATFPQSGGTAGGTLYVRLAATTAAGTYSGDITFSSGATSVLAAIPSSVVSAKVLTITGLSAGGREYDGTTAAALSGTAAYAGLVNGESFAVAGSPTAAFADANVGTGKAVTVSGFAAPSGNYTVTQPTGLTAAITAKALTIAGVTATSREYDRTVAAALDVAAAAYVGLVAGESFAVAGTPIGAFADKHVGTGKAVTVSGFTAPSGNYTVSQPTGLTAAITAKAVTVTGAAATSRAYDGTTAVAVTGGALSGAIAGDDVSLGGSPTGSLADKNAGTGKGVSVSGFALLGADAGNYSLSQPELTANVTPKALTVTASNRSRVYGAGNPLLTATIAGFVAGETQATALTGSPRVTTSATASSPVGTYALVPEAFTLAANDGNYSFWFVNGTLTVSKANLQVVIDNKTKVSGQADPTFTFGVLGLVNGDTAAAVLQGAATRTVGESAGSYTISKGTLALQSGGAAGNYNTPTFTNGTLTIVAAPKPLAVTGAFVRGSVWTDNYLALSSFSTASGGTRLGWALGDGANQLANSRLVTWSNVDRISVRFSEAITNPGTNSLSLVAITGTGTGSQATITATAAPVLSEGNTVATWTVSSLATGKYTLVLRSTAFTSVATGGQLDGEWTTGSSTFAAGSGNGTAGGDLRFRFNVLVGDVNASGTVANTDYTAVTSQLNASVTTSNFRSDVNGSGTIVGTDATAVSALIGRNLPTGNEAPAVTAAVGATVDASFDLTYADDAAWRGAITGVRVGPTAGAATAIANAAWAAAAGKLTLDPAQAAQLQTSGNRVVVISATGYADVTVTQALAVGAAAKLGMATQPTGPATNGGTLATAPVVRIQDQYGNTVTTSTAAIVAAVEAGTGSWTLGGTLTRNAVAGSATFSGLTATRSSGTVSGARIRFTSGSLTLVVSGTFSVP